MFLWVYQLLTKLYAFASWINFFFSLWAQFPCRCLAKSLRVIHSFCVPLRVSSACPHLNAHFAWQLGRSPAFPLSTLKMWFYCLLASAAAAEKSRLPHIGSFVRNLLFVLWPPFILSLLSLMFHCDTTRCGFNYISFAQDFFLFIFLFWSLIYFLESAYCFPPKCLEYFWSSIFITHSLWKSWEALETAFLPHLPPIFFFLDSSLLFPIIDE